jgi:GT2 family glycosyltransferase/glycosyltransferase involved in cell wall biosynthesis
MSKTPTAADLYQDWIASHIFQHNDGVNFEARMATWPRAPRFHLAVAQDTASVQALSLTLQSLAGQYYPHLFVSVASPLAAPPNLPADRIAWIQTDATWQGADQALRDGPSEWVGLIRAGDRVAPHTFLALAEHIVSHPELAALYTDEDICEEDGYRHSPRFKPCFDIELLRSTAYLGGLLLIQQQTWSAIGGWHHYPYGVGELDLALRLTECLPPRSIGHYSDVLYHRHPGHPSLLTDAAAHQQRLTNLNEHLARTTPNSHAIAGQAAGTARVLYPLQTTPRVSIVIPTRDQFPLLERCISRLFELTEYPDYEVLIVDNGSTDSDACNYLEGIRKLGDTRLRVLMYDHPFNYSAMNNLAAREATGSLLLLLNNDTAVLHPDWLAEMVALIQQPNVGMVGARLLYPDGTLQHAGVILGLAGPAEHPYIGWPNEQTAPLHRTHALQRYSAVTAACALLPRDLYLELGGMDELAFKVSYNDVDLCLKIGEHSLRILWTPYATLLHEGSASQKTESISTSPKPEKEVRFAAEQEALYRRWMSRLVRDPATNPNLSLANRDLPPEAEATLSWNPTPWNPHPRILVHPIDQTGSGQYRTLNPARTLHQANLCRGYASQRFFSPVEIAKANVDSIVIQFPTTTRHLKALDIYRQYSKALRIVELDDLITDIPRASPLHSRIGKTECDYFFRSLGLADRLVVTTDALATAYGARAPEVLVVPNYLVSEQWADLAPARHINSKPRVGWAGSHSHLGDLALIREVIKTLANDVDWVFFGVCPPDIRRYVKEAHNAVPFDQYPATLAGLGLDLAIAPLEDNPFNEAKSSLKLLEYGILGYPVVCSNVGPYQAPGFPVQRVTNTSRAWITAILDRIHDLDAAHAEGEALQAHVRQHWMLEDHLDEWRAAWTR